MIVVIVILGIWAVSSLTGGGTGSSMASAITANTVNGVQEISMNLSPAGYAPNNFVVKQGIPVRVNTNSTEDAGCVRGIMIPDFNINKALNVGNDSFEFIPDKTGEFTFTCQMKMSTGTLKVVRIFRSIAQFEPRQNEKRLNLGNYF